MVALLAPCQIAAPVMLQGITEPGREPEADDDNNHDNDSKETAGPEGRTSNEGKTMAARNAAMAPSADQ
jgi:hypothetical protein